MFVLFTYLMFTFHYVSNGIDPCCTHYVSNEMEEKRKEILSHTHTQTCTDLDKLNFPFAPQRSPEGQRVSVSLCGGEFQ